VTASVVAADAVAVAVEVEVVVADHPHLAGVVGAVAAAAFAVVVGRRRVEACTGVVRVAVAAARPSSCVLEAAFNYGGIPIRGAKKGWSYPNKSSTTYAGKAGDSMSYIVSAPYLEEFLTKRWGKPDARLKTNAEADVR
jgi:hypothetical protein